MKVCKDCKSSDLAYNTFVSIKTGEKIDPIPDQKYFYCLRCREYVLWDDIIPEMFSSDISEIIKNTKDYSTIPWKKYWFQSLVYSIKKDLPESYSQSFFNLWIELIHYQAKTYYPKSTIKEINSMCYTIYYLELLDNFKIYNNIGVH